MISHYPRSYPRNGISWNGSERLSASCWSAVPCWDWQNQRSQRSSVPDLAIYLKMLDNLWNAAAYSSVPVAFPTALLATLSCRECSATDRLKASCAGLGRGSAGDLTAVRWTGVGIGSAEPRAGAGHRRQRAGRDYRLQRSI
jgi:hypothetical protein